jgi:hypothetical protein
MGKSLSWKWLAVCALIGATAVVGCKSDDGGGGGDTDGGSSGGAGEGGGDAGGPDPVNKYCPTKIGPFSGEYDCCYREANSTRLEETGDSDMATLEYRLQYVQTNNHPMSIGQDALKVIGQSRSENEEQSILWRFTGPYKGGKAQSGDGTITIGSGRYNCDGTYSYYSDKAAPGMKFGQGADRWVAPVVPVKIDTTKDKPQERTVPVFDKNANRGYTLSPYLNSTDFSLDWELVNQGFTIDSMPTDDSAKTQNCIGSRNKSGGWDKGGTFIVYTPIGVNNTEPITAIGGQTYCQLVAFGVLNADEIKSDAVSCSDTVPRCKPGSKDCRWIKLPDSLCPVDAKDQANWGCHIGDENNVDNVKTNCTATAPTGKLDPAMGAKSEGQCCDPLGMKTGGLPACNAYYLSNDFVAAAADITDDLKDDIQPNCHEKK